MAGDIREIDMAKATNLDGKKVRLVGDDGKGYWMEKDTFISVVGGLINSQKLYPFMYKGKITSENGDSLKTLFTPGYYYFLSMADSVSSELEYPPIVSYTYMYGILEVIVSDDLVLQRITSNNVVYFRFGTKSEFINKVVPWKKITPTTV